VNSMAVLEKQDGKWKTVNLVQVAVSTYKSKELNVENTLNQIGYQLIANKNFKDAIAVLKLNVQLYPTSWNTWDSLGEAYMLNGDRKLAIQNLKKSLALNFNNENAKNMLEKLLK